jgi:hypothetical protein
LFVLRQTFVLLTVPIGVHGPTPFFSLCAW